MLAEPATPTRGQADGGFELSTDGQRRCHVDRQAHRHRGVPAAAADRLAARRRDHRVVARQVDGAVVVQPGVGDVCQPALGLVRLGAQRLVAEVRAGEDQAAHRVAGNVRVRVGQQMVKPAVGQHHAQPRLSRGDRVAQGQHSRVVEASGREHDRRLHRGEQPLARVVQVDDAARDVEVGCQQCERLGRAALALPQPRDDVGSGGVARQVVAADALDRHDAPGAQNPSGRPQSAVPGRGG